MALTCVEMLDGSMKMGEEMTTVLVEWNRQHFQQPIRNGATTANGGAFSKELQPHETSIEEIHNNTRAILEGTLDRTIVQNHEFPFYDALHRTTNELLETISEECKEKEFHENWAKINEQKSSSPSGRYVGLYKVIAVAVMDPEIKEKQQAMREVIRQISNACTKIGYILDRWRLASDVMLPKKLNN